MLDEHNVVTHGMLTPGDACLAQYRPESIRGKNYVQFLPKSIRERIRACLEHARRTGQASETTFRSPYPPHEMRTVRCVPGRRPADVMVIVYRATAQQNVKNGTGGT